MTKVSSIIVSLAAQKLALYEASGMVVAEYAISSALRGPSEISGSFGTPRGRHIIRAKIGEGCPMYSVFVGRRPTGEIYSADLGKAFPDRDWILTRILWLSGTERGKNRLGHVDTMRRYIYIHGAPDELPIGIAGSHGCIRMRNRDVLDLFARVKVGTPVQINEN